MNNSVPTEFITKIRVLAMNCLYVIARDLEYSSETLFLSCQIFNRYVDVNGINKEESLTCIITSSILAAKVSEERNFYSIADFMDNFSGRTCSISDVIEYERKILKALDYRLTIPTSYNILERILNHSPDLDSSEAKILMSLEISIRLQNVEATDEDLANVVALLVRNVGSNSEKVKKIADNAESMINKNKKCKQCNEELAKFEL